jgi:hypothetical protein
VPLRAAARPGVAPSEAAAQPGVAPLVAAAQQDAAPSRAPAQQSWAARPVPPMLAAAWAASRAAASADAEWLVAAPRANRPASLESPSPVGA